MNSAYYAAKPAGSTRQSVTGTAGSAAPQAVSGVARCGAGRMQTRKVCTVSDGFTLLELIVVLAIISIAIGIGAPLFSNAVPGAQLRAATSDLAAALRTTRNKAITRNRSMALVLDTRARQYRLEQEPAPKQLPDKIDLLLVTAESERLDDFSGRIRFFPDGSSTGGRIVLTGDGRSFSIGVNWILGRIQIGDG